MEGLLGFKHMRLGALAPLVLKIRLAHATLSAGKDKLVQLSLYFLNNICHSASRKRKKSYKHSPLLAIVNLEIHPT